MIDLMSKSEEEELIHLHIKEVKPSFYILILLIPSVVFVLMVAAIYGRLPRERAASTARNEVLSKEGGKMVTINNRKITVAVADDELSRRKGLAGVEVMGDGEGMLFVFENQDVQPPFWMKEMKMEIDIIWINDGVISQIMSEVPPAEAGIPERALELYIPDEPADYVLEVASGWAKRNAVNVGDSVEITQGF